MRIDTLVLEGAAELDPATLEGAVQQALAALVASGGAAPARGRQLSLTSAPRLAAAVYDALPGSVSAAGRRGSEG